MLVLPWDGVAFPQDVLRAVPSGHPSEKLHLPEVGWQEHYIPNQICSSQQPIYKIKPFQPVFPVVKQNETKRGEKL